MAPDDPYDAFAPIYDDFWAARRPDLIAADVPFYLDLAAERARGRAVLELGCGTGRVLVPLARDAAAGRGAALVLGLDRSPGMLEVARRRLREEGPAVRERARLIRADMARFALGRPVALAIVALRSLSLLETPQAQACALGAIRDALGPAGTAALHLCARSASADVLDAGTGCPAHLPSEEAVRRAAARAGLEVEAVYAWFDRRPLAVDSEEMIFLLRRP